MATDASQPDPIMTDQPEDEAELRERSRSPQEATEDLAIPGLALGGVLGGSAGLAAGAIVGLKGALTTDSTEAERWRESSDSEDGATTGDARSR